MIQKLTIFFNTSSQDVMMFGICIMLIAFSMFIASISFLSLAVLRLKYYKAYTKRSERR